MSNDVFQCALRKFEDLAPQFPYITTQAIDEVLADVMRFNDARVIMPLIVSLSDSVKDDAGMFSIVHAVESFDDDLYTSELLKTLPTLRLKAPRWGSILLMRSMNNDRTRETLVRKLHSCSPEVKEAAIWFCEKINLRSPTFLQKTAPVLVSAKM